jgi:hypothetical protein
MTNDEIRAYVQAAARAQSLDLTTEQLERVIAVFARTAAIAEPLLAFPLPDDLEMAPVFRA